MKRKHKIYSRPKRPFDKKRIDEAIKVIVEEYNKVKAQSRQGGIKSEEIKKAKQFLKGHLVLELENSRNVAGFYAGQEILEKRIDTPEEIIEKIKKVEIEDLVRVAKKIFVNKTLNLAIIGQFDSRQRFESLLEL